MPSIFTRLSRDPFYRHNVIFFIGSITVAALNYLFHPVLSRILPVAAFGELEALLSLLTQLSLLITVFGLVVTNVVTNSDTLSQKKAALDFLQSLVLYLVLALSFLLIVGHSFFSSAFHFSSPLPFLILALILITSVPFTFQNAYLQGNHDFTSASIANVVMAGGRLFFAFVLVYIGWSTFGAITGLAIAQIAALAYTYRKTRGHASFFTIGKITFDQHLKEELRYGALVLCAMGFVLFLSTADIIVVKHYFSPEIAGLYSGISTIARILFFVTSSISAVLLASVKLRAEPTHNRKTLLQAAALLIGLGGATLLLFSLFPSIVTTVLLGSRYRPFAALLPRLSLVFFVASLVNLFFSYGIALRRFSLILISLMGTVALFVLCSFFHATLFSIINVFLAVGTVVLAIVMFFTVLGPHAKKL
jgi:O-antigen/teichoic acid export membrane protein